ncbi:MAG: viral A-type inclusion protein [Bacteroidota bacterium]|nr:viral A-type inclusion protein [Bacteroidota bacterium]
MKSITNKTVSMKPIYLILPAFLLMALGACNNSGIKPKEGSDSQKAMADSLQDQVIAGHDAGMAKTRLISRAKKEAERLIDSINKLPAKAREAAKPYKIKLDSLISHLDNASLAMDKWMEEFNFDSAKNNLEQRIKYLTEEKIKVGKVKEAILGSLQKADSVIKSKF